MSQAPMTIGADKTGLQYRTEDNDRAGALATLSKGNAAPTDATGGRVWLDDSATPWKLKVYDAADWITLGEINAGTNTFTPYIGAAAARILNQAADTGAANAYAIAPVPAIGAYVTGHIVTFRPANTNTGASTLTVSGLAAKTIKLANGSDISAGAMVAGGTYMLVYDGVYFVLINPSIALLSAITELASQALTSGSEKDFTGLPAGIKRLKVKLAGLSTNGTGQPLIQIGDAGGWKTANYAGSGRIVSSYVLNTTGFAVAGTWNAATVTHAVGVLDRLDATSNTWLWSIIGGNSSSAQTTDAGGSVTLSGSLDRLRLITTDTFDAGSIGLSYEV